MDTVNNPLNNISQIITYGCKVNTFDTALIETELSQIQADLPPLYILNTCAVTSEATQEALKKAKQLKKAGHIVIVTGCGAQVDTEYFEPYADLIIANSEKSQFTQIIKNYLRGNALDKTFKSPIFKNNQIPLGLGKSIHKTRAFLRIQDGCNQFCSYCVIPFARGKSRSVPASTLVDHIKQLVALGVKEVVLTGVHIADYKDQTIKLEKLIEIILQQTQIDRIRLTSLEPQEVTSNLLELYKNQARLCPHFHLSIQSGSKKILKLMRRRYEPQAIHEAILRIKSLLPKAFIGIDMIVGFPGESEFEFEESHELLNQLEWTKLHVFPYSERPGTRALKLSSPIEKSVRKKRSQILRDLSKDRVFKQAQKEIGTKHLVLGLKNDIHNKHQGISRSFWSVKAQGLVPSQEKLVHIESVEFTNSSFDPILSGTVE